MDKIQLSGAVTPMADTESFAVRTTPSSVSQSSSSSGVQSTSETKSGKTAETVAPREVVSRESIEKMVKEANDLMKHLNNHLEFSVDSQTKDLIVKIVATDTKRVIREIPPEEVLHLRQKLRELSGLIFDEEV